MLRLFVQVLASLTLLCGAAERFAASVLHLNGRYVYPLLNEFYPDFVYFTTKFLKLHTLSFFTTSPSNPFMYPAPVALPYALFFFGSPQHSLRYFLAAMLGGFALAAILLLRALHARGLPWAMAAAFVASALLLSYPIWFVFHQANMEFAVWVILSLGLWAFFHKHPYLAGICFAAAGAMKLFPFVYLGLLLARKQFRVIVVSLAFAVALTLVSLWVVYPDIRVSWHQIEAGIGEFRSLYMLHLRPERGFDHSIFGLLKQLWPTLPPPSQVAHLLSLYLLLAAVWGVTVYFVRIRKLPVINQVLCLCIASILLPPTSFDYTLIHLYAPWALLILHAVDRYAQPGSRPASPALLSALLCLGVLFAPLTEFIVGGETVGGPIRCSVLILLFAIALRYPFLDEEFEQSCLPAAAAPPRYRPVTSSFTPARETSTSSSDLPPLKAAIA